LRSGKHNARAQLYAFDMLAGDGDDHRHPTVSLHRANLARLLTRRVDGIFIAEYEQGDIGPGLFASPTRPYFCRR
jgi:bifunctional non-homologous end joining protein LigD